MPPRQHHLNSYKEKHIDAPVRAIVDDKFNVTALECLQMEFGEPDASGRRSPVAAPGSEYILPFDCVIRARGDIATGAATVIAAMNAGRRAAASISIHQFLTS
jgi:NADPH-dependent glutamate synthase beta subunit-like oxidoreductase